MAACTGHPDQGQLSLLPAQTLVKDGVTVINQLSAHLQTTPRGVQLFLGMGEEQRPQDTLLRPIQVNTNEPP